MEHQTNTNKISQEDLEKIRSLQTGYNEKLIAFGDLKIRKINIQKQWEELEEFEKTLTKEFLELGDKEAQLATELTTKYGKGKLNLDTGEFQKIEE